MAKSASPKPIDELNYEEALAELEKIVLSLETDKNPLDEAMKLFGRGQALVARCSGLLEAAQLKIQQLTGENLTPYEEEA